MELYYMHPMLTECTATVLFCEKTENGYAVALDQSIIFPEGGGQLSDKGFIDDAEIFFAKTIDGRTMHFCSTPFEVGSQIKLRLDIASRLDHTAQHTGEHILSGLASKLFNAKNIGFHMAVDYCTVDFDLFLNDSQLSELQVSANRAVRANLPITTELVNGTEAASRQLRKMADKLSSSTEDIRIVYIDGGNIDSCTCCGTHFARTGEVGAIFITDSQKYKGGTRIWFACGDRAIRHAISQQTELTSLARRFSTSRDELPNAVQKVQTELSSCKLELKIKSRLISELLGERLLSSAANVNSIDYIVKLLDYLAPVDLKMLSDFLIKNAVHPLIALLFCTTKSGTDYRMVCSSGIKLSMRELCDAVNIALNGKGGGNSLFAQGKTAKQVNNDDILMLENYVRTALIG